MRKKLNFFITFATRNPFSFSCFNLPSGEGERGQREAQEA